MQAEDTEWHQGTGWLRHILIAFRGGKDPCMRWKGLALNPALSACKAELGYPREQVSQEIPVFSGQECMCKHRISFRWRWGSRLPFLAPSVVVSDPSTPNCLFSSLEWVLESPGQRAVHFWSLALRKVDPHMEIAAPHILFFFGLHFWIDCTLLSESLTIKWEISMPEKNSSVVMSRAVNLGAGLLPLLHPSRMISQLGGSLKTIPIWCMQVPNFCRKCSRTIPWCYLKLSKNPVPQ